MSTRRLVDAIDRQLTFNTSGLVRVRRDADGIPILGEQDIEAIAEHFLSSVAPKVLSHAGPTPLVDIAAQLQEEGHCRVRFDLDLGHTSAGHKVLGYFDIVRKEIAVDRSLIHDDPRFPFTLAHEMGHFYLHSKVKQSALALGGDAKITDSTRDLVTHRIASTRPRSLLEWQANHFAAGVLLPRRTLPVSLETFQKQIGIVKNLGLVIHDPNQPISRSDLRRAIEHLSRDYRVSRAVVRFRLYELGLVREAVPGRGPIRVGAFLADALSDLFAET